MADHPSWHRQEGEGARAYACFCRYRDYGPDRSIRKAVRAYLSSASKDSQPRRYHSHPKPQAYLRSVAWWWGKLSRRYRWVERVKAFDENQAALRQKIADQRAIAEMEREVAEEERQRELRREEARAARTVGRQILRRVLQAVENRELENLPLAAILPHLQKVSTLIEAGQRLERQEVGQSAPEAPQIQISDEQAKALAIIVRDYVPAEQWDEAVAELERALLAMRPEA